MLSKLKPHLMTAAVVLVVLAVVAKLAPESIKSQVRI